MERYGVRGGDAVSVPLVQFCIGLSFHVDFGPILCDLTIYIYISWAVVGRAIIY